MYTLQYRGIVSLDVSPVSQREIRPGLSLNKVTQPWWIAEPVDTTAWIQARIQCLLSGTLILRSRPCSAFSTVPTRAMKRFAWTFAPYKAAGRSGSAGHHRLPFDTFIAQCGACPSAHECLLESHHSTFPTCNCLAIWRSVTSLCTFSCIRLCVTLFFLPDSAGPHARDAYTCRAERIDGSRRYSIPGLVVRSGRLTGSAGFWALQHV